MKESAHTILKDDYFDLTGRMRNKFGNSVFFLANLKKLSKRLGKLSDEKRVGGKIPDAIILWPNDLKDFQHLALSVKKEMVQVFREKLVKRGVDQKTLSDDAIMSEIEKTNPAAKNLISKWLEFWNIE